MATTIQISRDLQKALADRKLFDRETYEEIIWDLIEDTIEISEQTKKDIAKARRDIREGRVYSQDEVKKELDL